MSEEIQNEDIKFHRTAIEWRRNFVLQRLSAGYSQSEIARELKLHPSTISIDCQCLRETAKTNLHTQIEERIPQQYAECHIGYKTILKKAYEIANDPNSKKSEVLQSLGLIADVYGKLMDLSTDGKTLEQAISWITKQKESLQQEQDQQEEELSSSSEVPDGAEEEPIEEEEEQT